MDLDSIRRQSETDSLTRLSLRNSLASRLEILGETPLDSDTQESYRMIAEFSWGNSPVGPMLAAKVRSDGQKYLTTIITFSDGKRVEHRGEADSTAFTELSSMFDSLKFAEQPIVLHPQYTAFDASKYFVERVKDGKYHGIVRSDTVEQFVYDLWIRLLAVAKIENVKMVEEFRRLSVSARKSSVN